MYFSLLATALFGKTHLICKSRSMCMMADKSKRILWFDGEMTGLNYETDKFLEVACIVTDQNLNIIAEGPNIIIHQPKEVLDRMNEWCIKTHTQSGLYDSSLKSTISVEEAEVQLLSFVKPLTNKGTCCIAGNSVYMDVLFLRKNMPKFVEHFHYQIIDVSSIQLLSSYWYKRKYEGKKKLHRALDDIKESIDELRYYRKEIFVK